MIVMESGGGVHNASVGDIVDVGTVLFGSFALESWWLSQLQIRSRLESFTRDTPERYFQHIQQRTCVSRRKKNHFDMIRRIQELLCLGCTSIDMG